MLTGFFDSGVGGITVLHEALKMLPQEDYIYFADTRNVPYGSKSKEDVRNYIFDAVEFIIRQKVTAVVIACNTATSVAIRDLRAKYRIPILGMEPAVKPAVEKGTDPGKRILVTATELTLKEEKLHNLIQRFDNDHVIDLLALPGLVQFAENMEFSDRAVLPYLRDQLSKYDLSRYETVVLGCTHFSFYRDKFKKLFSPGMDIIDGNAGTVKNLKRILGESGSLNKGSGRITFYHSGSLIEDGEELGKYNKLLGRLDEMS